MEVTKQLTYNLIDLDAQDIAIIEKALKLLVEKWEADLKPNNNVLQNNFNSANAILNQIHTNAFC